MFHYSLREFFVILIGVSASFAVCFLPAQKLGFYYYFAIVGSVLVVISLITVNFLVKRLAITIGVLLTIASSLGVFISFQHLTPDTKDFHFFAGLLALFGVPMLFITVPVTIHRLTGSPTRE